jgi:hypothetical protein
MNRLRRGYVFVSHEGRPMRAGAYRYYWIPVQDRFLGETDPKRRAELLEGKKATRKGSPPNLDLYELRHFCGSMLADRGSVCSGYRASAREQPAGVRRGVHPHPP